MATPARAAACQCKYANPTASVTGRASAVFLHTLVLLHEQAMQDNVGHARAVQGDRCGLSPVHQCREEPPNPICWAYQPIAFSSATTLATRYSRRSTRPATPFTSKVSVLRSMAHHSDKVSRLASTRASRGSGRTWWHAAAALGALLPSAAAKLC